MNRTIIFLFLQFTCWTCFYGCATAPAHISESSGDSNLAELLESIRVEERLPALAAAVIIDGKIYASAAVGTRKFGTEKWVTVDDGFLIASCSKAFTATLAALLIEDGVLRWNTTLREACPDLEMRSEYENITLLQLLSHRAGLPEWIDPLTSKTTNEQFAKKWWVDRKLPMAMRSRYLKETVMQELVDEPKNTVYYSGPTFPTIIIHQLRSQQYQSRTSESMRQAYDPEVLSREGN